MSEIKKTNDYSIFKKNQANRDIDSGNLKKLINSIKANNLLEYRPIIVDKQMRIIDGQHRLEAAKYLGVDIFYQLCKEATDEDIILLNTTQKRWGLEDYVSYYIGKGSVEYIKYDQYARQNGFKLMDILRLYKRGGTFSGDIRAGKLRFFTPEQQEMFEDHTKKYKEFMGNIRKYILTSALFLEGLRFEKAIRMMIKNEDIDWDLFMKKATIKSDAFKPCATSEAYYQLCLDIYNWKNQNKVYPDVRKTESQRFQTDHPDQLHIE